MARLVLLTPEPSVYEDRWPDTYAEYAAILGRPGLEIAHAPWTGPLPDADAYCPLLSWGYHLHYDRWRTFLDGLEASLTGERLINPVRTMPLEQGTKAYLLELLSARAPVPPTLRWSTRRRRRVELAIAGFGRGEGGGQAPAVSCGAHPTVRRAAVAGNHRRGGPCSATPLVQPFMPRGVR
jgi:hypothetical protein